MSYNLFLDDERQPKDAVYWDHDEERCWMIERPLIAWTIVTSFKEFVDTIQLHGVPSKISFDHDLDEEHYVEGRAGLPPRYKAYKIPTGYDCLRWLIAYCKEKNVPLPKCYCHSFNMHGRNNIFNLVNSYNKLQRMENGKNTGSGDSGQG